MVKIRVDDSQLKRYVSDLRHILGNRIKGIFKKLAKETLKRTKKRWDLQVNSDFEKWLPLSPSTIQRKGHAQILYDTGVLKDSIEYEVYNNGYELFTNIDYAPYHQFGTGSIEKREFLGFEDEEIERARAILVEVLEKAKT